MASPTKKAKTAVAPPAYPESSLSNRFFELADKNADGTLSRAEIVACCKSEAAFAEFVGLPSTIRDSERVLLEDFFQKADADGDKRITLEEFVAHFNPGCPGCSNKAPQTDPIKVALWFYKMTCAPPSTLHHFGVKAAYDAKYGEGSFVQMLSVVDEYVASVDFSTTPVAMAYPALL
jgi:hypothetical protein